MSGALHIARRLAGRLAAVCGMQGLAPALRLMAGNASLLDDLDALMGEAVRIIVEAEQHAKALKERVASITMEQKATQAAAQAVREALKDALLESGAPRALSRHHLAVIKPGRPKVVITDPEKVPERFLKIETTPRLSDIAKALEAGEQVPGAVLSNGEAVLEIKVRASEVPA